ncbi:Oxo-4-hydroxy-4-carboxy-5-ureidoimidazoline decarboxylase [Mycena pura]|uniref:Oxo-4-hydroxy-4-carboxy-5-ureidoimidazoline decarboxylase n=1 Tax=Mycena pura TaxID=153505 RepID=A0AAD6YWR3_9AGAR|nr:Oxo-4-hydroxy-4-carboxy-5-ureidoimidazoline decarboxylase [Mycena pura]
MFLDDAQLSSVLGTLLEPSKDLPALVSSLSGRSFSSYPELIDAAIAQVQSWDSTSRAEFIRTGHSRIGETNEKNLSALSATEQGASPTAAPTPPEVLARLAHLNDCYERRYPGLRYITFVNGRSRAAVALELEDVLGFPHSVSPDQPPVETISPMGPDTEAWKTELDRAVVDVGRIAKSRLGSLTVAESRYAIMFFRVWKVERNSR